MDSFVAAALVAAAAAGREASRRYDWSATEGAAMVAARAAGERALSDGATAEAALAAAAAAWRAVPLMEDWNTAAGAAIVAAEIAGCLVAREGTLAEKEALVAIAMAASCGTVSTGGVAYQGFRPRVAYVCIYAVYTVCTRVHTIAISGRRLRSEALRILPLSRRLSLKANKSRYAFSVGWS